MCPEETKEKKDEETCCNPKNFKGMFGMMNKYLKGEGSFDYSTIVEEMKNQSCCGPESEKATSGSDKETKSICC